MSKKRVAVVYGGKSGEHEISLLSAASIMQHIDRDRFDVVPIGIDKEGYWFLNQEAQVFFPQQQRLLVHPETPTPLALPHGENSFALTEGDIDVVFPAIHGPICEDGCIQGVFKCADIPFVGSGVLSSAMSMDKAVSKVMTSAMGIRNAAFRVEHDHYPRAKLGALYHECAAQLGDILFVKPACMGSSVGISRVDDEQSFIHAFGLAASLDHKIIIEQAIYGREIEFAVLEHREYGQAPRVSIAGEIIPSQSSKFYSYSAKYLDEQGAELCVPADISTEQLERGQALARQVFQTLDCQGMARVDCFLEHESGEWVFNEVNTLPGFTSISMYPRLWEASGISYAHLISELIDLAIERHHRDQLLVTDYHRLK